MAYDPIDNFDAGQIPDTDNETTFHSDATYVFTHLSTEVIPGINGAIDWMNAALPGDAATVIEALGAVTAKSGRNALINGGFDIWQRGASFTAAGYTADRWLAALAGGKTQTTSRQDFALGQTDVAGNPKHYLRAAVGATAAINGLTSVAQRIEGVDTFAGQEVTLSFSGKVDAGKDIAIRFTQNFGTGGSPSADVVTIPASNVTLGTSWDKHEVTVTLPSVNGKVLGSAGDDFLEVEFVFAAGTSFDAETNSLGDQSGTFEIAQVQLELGDAATDFERRPIGQEWQLCQRYFAILSESLQWRATTSSEVFRLHNGLPVKMRATPTISKTSENHTNAGAITVTAVNAGFYSFQVTGGSAASVSATVTASADSEL